MTNANFVSLSFEILRSFFLQEGYVFQPMGNQFRKERPQGWQNIILSFGHYEDCTLIELSFGSRVNIVEELIAPYTYGLRGYQAESNTTITNLSKYQQEPHFRFKIREEADLYRMAAHVRDFFRREGFDFLNQLSDLTTLDELFNKDPMGPCLVSFNHQLRSFRGIAIASLSQNFQWESLAQDYRALLTRYSSPAVVMDRFKDFSSYLATTALN